jgi:hypothetical protein
VSDEKLITSPFPLGFLSHLSTKPHAHIKNQNSHHRPKYPRTTISSPMQRLQTSSSLILPHSRWFPHIIKHSQPHARKIKPLVLLSPRIPHNLIPSPLSGTQKPAIVISHPKSEDWTRGRCQEWARWSLRRGAGNRLRWRMGGRLRKSGGCMSGGRVRRWRR